MANPIGRPTLYKPEYCQLLIDHLEQGYLYESFAGLISVNWDTLYQWEKVHEDFSEAKKLGLAKAMLFDEKLFKAGINNENINSTLLIFKLKNRYSRYYRDKHDVEVTGAKIELNIDKQDEDL